jgi:hypothetical protein
MSSSRASEGVHEGDKRNAAGVQSREDKVGIPGQDPSERSQAKNREERTCGIVCHIQQAQKVIAQQILKNNQMINKYNNLDAQLQNVTFEYVSYHKGCSRCASVNPCRM